MVKALLDGFDTSMSEDGTYEIRTNSAGNSSAYFTVKGESSHAEDTSWDDSPAAEWFSEHCRRVVVEFRVRDGRIDPRSIRAS